MVSLLIYQKMGYNDNRVILVKIRWNRILLVLGLSYLDISYKNWIKYIWKFALAMLACLVLIFALLAYV